MAAKDLGPLDWQVAIVDNAGRPSPEFQRRWNTQRNNNGLISPPGGTPGQIQFNSAGSFGGFTVTGDGTLSTATGVLIVTKTNGVVFAPSATIDTTNAGNISSGTLPDARLSNTAVTPGSYTSANITVDAHGRLTAAANGAGATPGGTPGQIQFNNAGAFGGFTASGDATINTGTGAVTLAASGVAAGSYTSANITVDAKGRVTAASNGTGGTGGAVLPLVTGDLPGPIAIADGRGQFIGVPL